MATLATLVSSKKLVQIGGGLAKDEQPVRLLYAYPHVIEWLNDTLPALEPFDADGMQSPLEQVDDLFHDFVAGEDFSFYELSHSMEPLEDGVWELKTPDIRLFGWFYKKGIFLAANIDTMERVKKHNLYAGYRDDVVRRRNQLDLDAPKFVTGGYADVL